MILVLNQENYTGLKIGMFNLCDCLISDLMERKDNQVHLPSVWTGALVKGLFPVARVTTSMISGTGLDLECA